MFQSLVYKLLNCLLRSFFTNKFNEPVIILHFITSKADSNMLFKFSCHMLIMLWVSPKAF